MIVLIYDIDWSTGNSSAPNYKAQKISSYHKQKGDTVNMINHSDSDKEYKYDLIYALRENDNSPMPPSRYLDHQKIKLVGSDFIYYDNFFELTELMVMVQPDYNLYDLSEVKNAEETFVLQLIHNGKMVNMHQEFIVKYKTSVVNVKVVDDLNLVDDIELEKYLQYIKKYSRLNFKFPFNLSRVINNQKILKLFLELKIARGSKISFKNDIGDDYTSAAKIIDFIYSFEKNNKGLNMPRIEFKTVTIDHYINRGTALDDFERCLKIMDYAKKKSIKIILAAPHDRKETYAWDFFEYIEQWSKSYYTMSYIEFMTSFSLKLKENKNKQWYDIVNNPLKWNTSRIIQLIYLIKNFPEVIFKYGVRKWGNETLNISKINISNIVNVSNYFERDDLTKRIQKEIQEMK